MSGGDDGSIQTISSISARARDRRRRHRPHRPRHGPAGPARSRPAHSNVPSGDDRPGTTRQPSSSSSSRASAATSSSPGSRLPPGCMKAAVPRLRTSSTRPSASRISAATMLIGAPVDAFTGTSSRVGRQSYRDSHSCHWRSATTLNIIFIAISCARVSMQAALFNVTNGSLPVYGNGACKVVTGNNSTYYVTAQPTAIRRSRAPASSPCSACAIRAKPHSRTRSTSPRPTA